MAEEKARDPTKPEVKPVNIPLSKIHDLPGSVFAPPSPKSLEALTSSIVLKGVQEPVILRQREDGEFQIVSGNRRRKASELAKQTEIPAFVYDMTEKEAKDFRFRNKGDGTPPGKLLPESEIGKKREAPAKAPDKTTEKATVTPQKPPEKVTDVKPAPTSELKKPEEKPKAVVPTGKVEADSKTPVTPPKPPEKPTEEKNRRNRRKSRKRPHLWKRQMQAKRNRTCRQSCLKSPPRTSPLPRQRRRNRMKSPKRLRPKKRLMQAVKRQLLFRSRLRNPAR